MIFMEIQDFSITQFLREINFWDFGSAKSAILTHLEALIFYCYEILVLLEGPKNGKNHNFRTLGFS